MKPSDFSISISSPPDRECLVAEIFFSNEQWAELNQDSGRLTLELYPRRDGGPWVFTFEDAVRVLNEAKEKLVGKDGNQQAQGRIGTIVGLSCARYGDQDHRERLAKVKTKIIAPNDFNIRFVPETLLRTKGGAVTAFIFWEFERFCFPWPTWSDFVAVIPGWWIEALREVDSTQTLRFMDGPYFITVTRVGAADLQIDCYEDRKEKGLVGSFRLPLERVREEVVAVSRAVVAAFRERNWNSRDLEHLSGLLINPWPTSGCRIEPCTPTIGRVVPVIFGRRECCSVQAELHRQRRDIQECWFWLP